MKSDSEVRTDTKKDSPAPAGSKTQMKDDMKSGGGAMDKPATAGARGEAGKTAGAAQPQPSDLLGKQALAPNGDDIGDVKAVITDSKGKIRGVVLDVGGFLGIGERQVAVGWDQITHTEKGDIRLSMSSEELEKLPKYEMTDQQEKEGVFEDTRTTF